MCVYVSACVSGEFLGESHVCGDLREGSQDAGELQPDPLAWCSWETPLNTANLRAPHTHSCAFKWARSAENSPDASTHSINSPFHINSNQSSTLPQSIQEVLICCSLVCLCCVHHFAVLWFSPSLRLLWKTQHEARLKAPPSWKREWPLCARLCSLHSAVNVPLYHMPLQINSTTLLSKQHKSTLRRQLLCTVHVCCRTFGLYTATGIVCLRRCHFPLKLTTEIRKASHFLWPRVNGWRQVIKTVRFYHVQNDLLSVCSEK